MRQMLKTISGVLFLLAVAQAQTTARPTRQVQPADNVKGKRALYQFEDSLIGPPPPVHFSSVPYNTQHQGFRPPTHYEPSIHSYQPTQVFRPSPANKWTNVFGWDDITYNQIFNEINGFNNHGLPTTVTPPPPAVPSIFTNGYGYVNYAPPRDYDTAYIAHDGRVVKQYSVHEVHHNDHPDPNNFRPLIRAPAPQTIPAHFPPYFNPSNNVAQPRNFLVNGQLPPTNNQIPTLLSSNHGPVAFGSGGLGFIRANTGEVHLGSGSLAYISHKDHYDSRAEITSRHQKSHPQGPLTFGHNHL